MNRRKQTDTGNDKIQVVFHHEFGGWKFKGYFFFDVLDEALNQTLRVRVEVVDTGASGNAFEVTEVAILVNVSLPKSITSRWYLEVLSSLEKEGLLEAGKPKFLDIPGDYYMLLEEPYTLSSSYNEPVDEEEIATWLGGFLTRDGTVGRIMYMFELTTSEKIKITFNSRGKSHSGVEKDIT